jgi:glutathione peroxidase
LTSTNYSQLVELHEKYSSQGLMIMGFPSTQFMNQEKNTNQEIIEFLNENNVKFPVFSKTIVNGENTHPLFLYLKIKSSLNAQNKGLKNIPWNFAKFLMDEDGNNVKFYSSNVKPKEIEDDILKMIKI